MKRGQILGGAIGGIAGAATAWALLPASTPPVRPLNATSTSIALLEPLNIRGAKLWTLQRGADVNNPILMYLHGGPGASELTFNRRHTQDLEAYFTIVHWDQRGAGKSYRAGRNLARMTIPDFVEDVAEVCRQVLKKFGQRKLFLLGRSWGSAIGLMAAARYPELFHAYIGIGQIANMTAGEQASYQWTLEEAIKRKDRAAAHRLVKMGPPPYSGDWMKKFLAQRKYVCRYGGEIVGNPHGSNTMLARSVLFGPEYTLAEKLHYGHAFKASLRVLQPKLMGVDFFTSIPEVRVPVFLLAGRHDRVVPQEVARQYFETLRAPHKAWHWFEHSAHMPDVEERKKFREIMLKEVLLLAGS